MNRGKIQPLAAATLIVISSWFYSSCGKTKSKSSPQSKPTTNDETISVQQLQSEDATQKQKEVTEKEVERENSEITQYYQRGASPSRAAAGAGTTSTPPGESSIAAGAKDRDAPSDLACFFGSTYPQASEIIKEVSVHFKPQPTASFAQDLVMYFKSSPSTNPETRTVKVEPTHAGLYLWKKNDWPAATPLRNAKKGDPRSKTPLPWAYQNLSTVDSSKLSTEGLVLSLSSLSSKNITVDQFLDLSFAWKLKLTSTQDLFARNGDYVFAGDESAVKHVSHWFTHLFDQVRVTINGKTIPYVLLAQRFTSVDWIVKTYPKDKKRIDVTIQHMWTENWVIPAGQSTGEESAVLVLQDQWDQHKQHCDALANKKNNSHALDHK